MSTGSEGLAGQGDEGVEAADEAGRNGDPEGGFDRQGGPSSSTTTPSPPQRHTFDLPETGAHFHQSCVFPLRLGRGGNDRDAHWRVRSQRARVTREVVGYEVFKAHFARPFPSQYPLTVLLGRHGPSQGLDDDNLAGSLKVVRDAIAAFLGRDDADPQIHWRYTQSRTPSWQVSVDILGDRP